MNRAVVRSFLSGVFTSHYLLGLAALAVYLGLVKFFPTLKLFGLTAGEAGLVILILSWVLIGAHKSSERDAATGGRDRAVTPQAKSRVKD